jgi:ribonuclease P protein component
MGAPRQQGPVPGGERLPRVARIHRGSEIRELLRRGRRERGDFLEVFSASTTGEGPRFGVVVPRYRHKVVKRNLLRRRLRELGRTMVLPRFRREGKDTDLLVRTRPRAYGASFSELRDELIRLTDRLCSDVS